MKCKLRFRICALRGTWPSVKAEFNTRHDALEAAPWFGNLVRVERSRDAGATWTPVCLVRDGRADKEAQ